MNQLLDHVLVEHNPNKQPINACVIWLHGLGANGHDFEPVVPQLGLNPDMAVRFIFPHAPSIPVTINGYVMPAWYDILEMSLNRTIDKQQILASAQYVDDFIKAQEKKGIPSERIVVAGFSQGGAVAYQSVLANDKKLAGLLALSTYFATKDSIHYHKNNQDTPIFIGHGIQDNVVPVILGEQANGLLSQKGYHITHKTYHVQHGVNLTEIKDIGQWLNQVLSPKK